MINGGERIATATGAMLADRAELGNASPAALESWFDPGYWRARGELHETAAGRGAAWFVGAQPNGWVLRHYRRGGLIARLSEDRYWWAGEHRVRAFAEWRLLSYLRQRGFAVPKPVAARYQRIGLTYRCDLVMQRIAPAAALSAALADRALEATIWRAVGVSIARLHRAGVEHADLNAHNILLGQAGEIYLIDFDRGRLREPGGWAQHNLRRLHRSLLKVSAALPADRFTPAVWNALLAGYET